MNTHLSITLLLACSSIASADILYETSFEKSWNASDKNYKDAEDAVWVSKKGFNISKKHAKTGKQSLHLIGGESEVVLHLRDNASKAKGLSFRAERWTSSPPFEFRISAKQGDKWTKLTPLDLIVQTGRGFPSKVELKLPEGEAISALKFTSTTPKDKGILIDDLKLLSKAPEYPSMAPPPYVKPTEPLKLIEHNDVFVSGQDNTKIYRIPAIITAKNGDLLAVIDARRNNAADLIHQRSIDITYKRSTDNGKSWGAMKTIADLPKGEGASDASLILNRDNGEIFCFYNWMGKTKEFRFYLQSSKDNGHTWSEPSDFTDQITPKNWGKLDFKFITSGRGIQTRNGNLLHNVVHLPTRAVYLYGSTDGGKTWSVNETPVTPGDESKVVELNDGTLMVNSRVGADYRWVHRSKDQGKTWESNKEYQLPDPRCNGSIIRYTSTKDGYAKDRLLFSNAGSQTGRNNLTIRISYDEGRTWSAGKVVNPGASAYSSLTILENGNIGVLYENGNARTKFASFTLEDLTDGKDKLNKVYEIR
ncbi:exo-alpha-sialidase [Verrucomicrobiaceae bacterium N1E253]|uniref:exo-alpha-sialidase n=1 Tax=Oceaniferula marina TaxID=2748318 RepID=A0A851G9X1_9BACT|nr:sialidase family protein [Oceaniferula marina]NWK54403.1 exo-alpha-sialidase [Oceaniferula marina]